MELWITRAAEDELFAVTCSGAGTRPGVKPAELQRWLRSLGAGETIVDNVMNIRPSETVTVRVPDVKAASG
jgi:hypothetical protein